MNIDKLKGYIPDTIFDQIPNVIDKFQINTTLRLSHFISQCAHESGDFKVFSENLNYSADGLKKIFPKYFPNDLALSYARQPEKIANRVYANRMGNGDEKSGDGYKFRGRGALQITGHDNYKSLSDELDFDFVKNPDAVSTDYALSSGAWFFKKNNLLSICDLGSDVQTIAKLTKRINGGTIGLNERIALFNKFYAVLKLKN